MGWTSKLLALAVTGALGAQALEASIFKLPSEQRHNDNPNTISEDVARAILELRLESSQASVLGGVDTDTVERLNHLSGAQSALFGGLNGAEAPKKSLLILEGLEHQVGMRSSNLASSPARLIVYSRHSQAQTCAWPNQVASMFQPHHATWLTN